MSRLNDEVVSIVQEKVDEAYAKGVEDAVRSAIEVVNELRAKAENMDQHRILNDVCAELGQIKARRR